MNMPKTPVSVTLGTENLLWLRARVATRKRRSLSQVIDEILTAARTGVAGAGPGRSVAGTIAIAPDDPDLERADAYVRALVEASMARPLVVHEQAASYRASGRERARKTSRRGKDRRGA